MVYVYIECNLILGGSSVRIDMSYLITNLFDIDARTLALRFAS